MSEPIDSWMDGEISRAMRKQSKAPDLLDVRMHDGVIEINDCTKNHDSDRLLALMRACGFTITITTNSPCG